MDLANCLVGIGGDRGHSVPKYGVTPAEILVLQSLHGDEAVYDIEKTGDDARRQGEERERLRAVYPARGADPATGQAAAAPVDQIFGRSPLPQRLRDLDLSDDLYMATGRALPEPEIEVEETEVFDEPEDEPVAPAPRSRKRAAAEQIVPDLPPDPPVNDASVLG